MEACFLRFHMQQKQLTGINLFICVTETYGSLFSSPLEHYLKTHNETCFMALLITVIETCGSSFASHFGSNKYNSQRDWLDNLVHMCHRNSLFSSPLENYKNN